MSPLGKKFFDKPPLLLAQALLGKVLRHRAGELWLSARIIETEAYEKTEKGSHASLGFTQNVLLSLCHQVRSICTTRVVVIH